MLIDCRTCVGRGLACDDCVVNVLLSAGSDSAGPPALDFDEVEQNALASLADAGLVPPLRMVPLVRFDAAPPRSARDIA